MITKLHLPRHLITTMEVQWKVNAQGDCLVIIIDDFKMVIRLISNSKPKSKTFNSIKHLMKPKLH